MYEDYSWSLTPILEMSIAWGEIGRPPPCLALGRGYQPLVKAIPFTVRCYCRNLRIKFYFIHLIKCILLNVYNTDFIQIFRQKKQKCACRLINLPHHYLISTAYVHYKNIFYVLKTMFSYAKSIFYTVWLMGQIHVFKVAIYL